MIQNVTPANLNEMDYGVHMQVLEEWNEDAGFVWQPAVMILHGFYTRIVQEDGLGGLIVATYRTHGEGDLVSLRIWASHGMQDKVIGKCGFEYWWTEHMEKDEQPDELYPTQTITIKPGDPTAPIPPGEYRLIPVKPPSHLTYRDDIARMRDEQGDPS